MEGVLGHCLWLWRWRGYYDEWVCHFVMQCCLSLAVDTDEEDFCHLHGAGGVLSDEDDGEFDEEDVDLVDGVFPSRTMLKAFKARALKMSLASGSYPEYKGCEGPYLRSDPGSTNPAEFLKKMWPDSLCDVLVLETNRYARSKPRCNWKDVNRDEIWTFLALNILLSLHKLPRIEHLWSRNKYLGIEEAQMHMTSKRFWEVWGNLHVVDNAELVPGDGYTRKFKPVLDVLSQTFFMNYCPAQELSVDEAMVKYTGHVKGKVYMPKKPIKEGFKIWCCCCSCCGYLCTFQMYEGRPTDPMSGEVVREKGMVLRVVSDLLAPFSGCNHVVYCDSFFSSGPLVEALAKEDIYLVGTIQQRASGFPESLKSKSLSSGEYAMERVGDTCYFAFQDRKLVSFVTNAFPESMGEVIRLQPKGRGLKHQSVPPLLPAYNKYMGGVDRYNHMRKTYGYDRKSRRYWLRPFFQFFDYAINNAYILYKHNCKLFGVPHVESFDFRLSLVGLLAKDTRRRKRPFRCMSEAAEEGGCTLKRVSDINMSRGKCRFCLQKKKKPVGYTSFGCSFCKVRLCKVDCFSEYHRRFS